MLHDHVSRWSNTSARQDAETDGMAAETPPEVKRTHAREDRSREAPGAPHAGPVHPCAPRLGTRPPVSSMQPPPLPAWAVSAPTETPERVIVPQAGVILLWPYLPTYLAALKLRHRGKFVASGRERAVRLLHYAASGSMDVDEHHLVLPKLLCGWPLEVPMAPGEGVADVASRERAETEELLDTVIAHWDALGRTSRAGLRSSFLHRPGLLALAEPPVLHVERRGFDVLLERLPYNLSVIKLSWMTTLLGVEW